MSQNPDCVSAVSGATPENEPTPAIPETDTEPEPNAPRLEMSYAESGDGTPEKETGQSDHEKSGVASSPGITRQ